MDIHDNISVSICYKIADMLANAWPEVGSEYNDLDPKSAVGFCEKCLVSFCPHLRCYQKNGSILSSKQMTINLLALFATNSPSSNRLSSCRMLIRLNLVLTFGLLLVAFPRTEGDAVMVSLYLCIIILLLYLLSISVPEPISVVYLCIFLRLLHSSSIMLV